MTRQVSGGVARAAGSGLYHHVKHQPARPGKRRHLLAGLAFAALVFPLTSTHGSAAEQNFPANGSWAVPAGVSIVQVFIAGGSGGKGGRNTGGTGPALGGAGLAITAGLNVTAGETVYIGLGANGQDNSTNPAVAATSAFGIGPGGKYTYTSAQGAGGGGGGASAIAVNDDIVVIAGGGGGAGGWVNMAVGTQPYSGRGGAAGVPGVTGVGAGSSGEENRASLGGAGGSSLNGTLVSILSRTGGGGGGGASAANKGFNVGGGGGGAGFYGGREGNGGGGDLDDAAGGGGGGGASYASPARIPQGTNAYVPAASSTSPSGRIDYINITTTALADATTSVAYTATLTASFGVAGTPDQWAVSPALPTGIALDPDTGAVSGTATTASTGTYTFTATEFAGGRLAARSSVNLNLTVVDPPTPAPTPTPEPTGIASPGAVTDSGSTQPSILAPDLSAVAPGHFTFDRNTPSEVLVAVNRGGSAEFSVDPVLPDGLTLDRSAGILRGTPTSVQEKTEYTITAVNTRGRSSTQITVRVSGSAPASAATLQPSSVRFAARSQKLTRGMKAALSVWHAERPGQALALTGVIPRSGNGFSLARQRATKVRQFLKKRGAEVSPIIRITRANTPPMTRRVLLAP